MHLYTTDLHCSRIHWSCTVGYPSKLEPKLVSALSETKRLFQLFRFYNEIESFDVSFESKQTEDQPKQFDRKHILVFLQENLGFFRFASVCFGLFQGHSTVWDSVTRFSTSGFFHESVSPKPRSIPLGSFRIFSKILGDICSSRFANNTGGYLQSLKF
jgi:hypothetical protein